MRFFRSRKEDSPMCTSPNLKKCCSWWTGHESPCTQLIQLIEQGRTPDFKQELLDYRDPFI